MSQDPDSDPAATETQKMPPTEEDPADRRRFLRVPLAVRVDLRSEANFFTGFSENISEGGLFVATEAPHPMGEVLEVELSLMGGDAIQVRGEVAWIRPRNARGGLPAGFGLRFLGLESDLLEDLQQFVDSRVKDTLFFDLD